MAWTRENVDDIPRCTRRWTVENRSVSVDERMFLIGSEDNDRLVLTMRELIAWKAERACRAMASMQTVACAWIVRTEEAAFISQWLCTTIRTRLHVEELQIDLKIEFQGHGIVVFMKVSILGMCSKAPHSFHCQPTGQLHQPYEVALQDVVVNVPQTAEKGKSSFIIRGHYLRCSSMETMLSSIVQV